MSKNRMINTRFWSDSFISNIDPLEKLLFLYLITNQYTNICGVYEIPLKQIALDTGIDKDNLEKVFLPRLQKAEKVYYFEGWVYIKNFLKHQKASGNVTLGIESGLAEVPSDILAKIKGIEGHTPLTRGTQGGHSLKLKPKPKPKLYISPPTSGGINNSSNPMYRESVIEIDALGEPIEQTKFKLPRGFIARIAKHYMAAFNVPETKGLYFAYKPIIESMIELARKIASIGDNLEKIEQEIKSRIDMCAKRQKKEGWKKIKLITILENWNEILTWKYE